MTMSERATSRRLAGAAMARAILLAILLAGMAACSDSSPSSPTPQPQPQLAVFTDAAGGMSSSDVRDVDEQIVRFDRVANTLIWTASGASFPGFPVSGNFIGPTQGFEVRFGTQNGQRRAYFTERGPGTICNIEVANGQLVISPTNVAVPG
jgi:hypothetical protein